MSEMVRKGRPPKKKPPENLPATTDKAGAEIAKRKRITPSSIANGTSAKSEDVSRILSNCMNWYKHPKVESADELRERTVAFFTGCIENGEIPTWEKYCLCTGYYRETIWQWVTGNATSELGSEANNIVKKAKDFLATFESELVTEGKVNPTVYIFRAKNYFGMKDQQEYVLTPNQPLGSDAEPTAIAGKYREALPESEE